MTSIDSRIGACCFNCPCCIGENTTIIISIGVEYTACHDQRPGQKGVRVTKSDLQSINKVFLEAERDTRDNGETANHKVNELVKHLLIAIATIIVLLAIALGPKEAFIVAIAVPMTLAITLASERTPQNPFAASGLAVRLQPVHFEPVGNRQFLVRMLANLKGIYWRQEAWDKVVRVIDRTLALNPDAGGEWRDRGAAWSNMGRLERGATDWERYLTEFPDAADSDPNVSADVRTVTFVRHQVDGLFAEDFRFLDHERPSTRAGLPVGYRLELPSAAERLRSNREAARRDSESRPGSRSELRRHEFIS